MREDIRMKVLDLLKTYPDNMRKIAQLNYELAHPSQISATEMLEAMAFKKGNGERHSVGEVSDKTLYIAMNYRNEAFRKTVKCLRIIIACWFHWSVRPSGCGITSRCSIRDRRR